jgi:outer membrane lipoprotein SlyB
MEIQKPGLHLAAKKSLLIVMTLAATACVSTDEIIIDEKGVNMAQYEQDLAECRSYGEQVATESKMAKGAGSGALVGGLIGAIVDGGEGAARGAGVGAVTGGAKGARSGDQEEVQVVKRCLSGRGYRLLN